MRKFHKNCDLKTSSCPFIFFGTSSILREQATEINQQNYQNLSKLAQREVNCVYFRSYS